MHETAHLRAIVIALGNHQRVPMHQSAALRGSKRVVERPVRGNAKVQRQRIGLAAGQHHQRRPGVAEHARATGQHIAHGAVTPVDGDIIHVLFRKFGENARQFAATTRRGQQHVVTQIVGASPPFVAVAPAIADQPHQRAGASGGVCNPPFGARNRVDLRQALEEMNASVHNLLALNMRPRQMLRFSH